MTNFKEWLGFSEVLSLKGDYKYSIYQRLVAAAYHLAPTLDPASVPYYAELYQKMNRQNAFLKHDYEFVPSSTDTYRSMKHLKRSIDDQRAQGTRRAKMFVYAEPPGPEGDAAQQGHPVLTNDQNVMIRGVHDAIAHLAGKHPFSARGEYAAYNRHLKTLCNIEQAKSGNCKAAHILFTEIVGQTSCYYVYGDFTVQKAAILWDFDHYNIGHLAPESYLNRFFVVADKDLIPSQDFDYSAFLRTPIGMEFRRQEEVRKSPAIRDVLPKSQATQLDRA